MPHIYVEYSANLTDLPKAALLEQLTAAVCGHPTITDEADVKTRLRPETEYQIGLNSTGRAFVHVQLSLMSGRTPEVRKELSDRLAAVLQQTVTKQDGLEIQLSVDIVDMERTSYYKGKR